MSGFDENPFGEPNVNDPFADPAVRKAASSIQNKGIEDYNPFADQPTGTSTPQVRGAANPPIYGQATTITSPQPATLQTSTQESPLPNYNRNPQQNISSATGTGTFSPTSSQAPRPDGWVGDRAQDPSNPYFSRRNNWPPLPESCCIQPCFFQDIDVDIQTDFQKIVRQLYYLWIFHGFVLILNIFGGLLLCLITDTTSKNLTIVGMGIVYLVLFLPFSFICWFRPAYQAFKNDSSFNFMVFFFIFFFQCVISVYQSIGLPNSATIGLITAISSFDSHPLGIFLGLILLSIASCFVMVAVADIILITKVHRIYKSTGASVSKAQEEFTSRILRNEHVQNAASNVAANAFRSQVNNMTQNITQPRY